MLINKGPSVMAWLPYRWYVRYVAWLETAIAFVIPLWIAQNKILPYLVNHIKEGSLAGFIIALTTGLAVGLLSAMVFWLPHILQGRELLFNLKTVSFSLVTVLIGYVLGIEMAISKLADVPDYLRRKILVYIYPVLLIILHAYNNLKTTKKYNILELHPVDNKITLPSGIEAVITDYRLDRDNVQRFTLRMSCSERLDLKYIPKYIKIEGHLWELEDIWQFKIISEEGISFKVIADYRYTDNQPTPVKPLIVDFTKQHGSSSFPFSSSLKKLYAMDIKRVVGANIRELNERLKSLEQMLGVSDSPAREGKKPHNLRPAWQFVAGILTLFIPKVGVNFLKVGLETYKANLKYIKKAGLNKAPPVLREVFGIALALFRPVARGLKQDGSVNWLIHEDYTHNLSEQTIKSIHTHESQPTELGGLIAQIKEFNGRALCGSGRWQERLPQKFQLIGKLSILSLFYASLGYTTTLIQNNVINIIIAVILTVVVSLPKTSPTTKPTVVSLTPSIIVFAISFLLLSVKNPFISIPSIIALGLFVKRYLTPLQGFLTQIISASSPIYKKANSSVTTRRQLLLGLVGTIISTSSCKKQALQKVSISNNELKEKIKWILTPQMIEMIKTITSLDTYNWIRGEDYYRFTPEIIAAVVIEEIINAEKRKIREAISSFLTRHGLFYNGTVGIGQVDSRIAQDLRFVLELYLQREKLYRFMDRYARDLFNSGVLYHQGLLETLLRPMSDEERAWREPLVSEHIAYREGNFHLIACLLADSDIVNLLGIRYLLELNSNGLESDTRNWSEQDIMRLFARYSGQRKVDGERSKAKKGIYELVKKMQIFTSVSSPVRTEENASSSPLDTEQTSLFDRFVTYWNARVQEKGKRREKFFFMHLMVNALAHVGGSFREPTKIRLYPHPQDNRGFIGILKAGSQTKLSVEYTASNGIKVFNLTEDYLRDTVGKEYDWDWIEERFTLERISKVLSSGKVLSRVSNLRRVYERYIELLGITSEEEKFLRSNLATATYYCAIRNKRPDEAIEIYLQALELRREDLTLQMKRQLIIATYEVAMYGKETSLRKVIDLYAEVLGRDIPSELKA
ncbi:MAG: tetratricopeptide repeat protein, partial [Candidatus Omnitrophica bacterium]|nr:tetratricopeptide repeat protein [Candidatus Omnitrophota bacterium]